MAAEPDHLLWKCLCCEGWVEIFRPRFSLSHSVCLSLIHTHSSLWLRWAEQGWEEALCSFYPLSVALDSPRPSSFPHIDPPPLSSDFALRTKQLDREGFPAGPDLSCKKMTHLWKKVGKREKRQFRERKHKQRCFNMMVASGTQRKVEGGKRKIAHNTNPLNDSLEA